MKNKNDAVTDETAELSVHTWTNGICTNPDIVSVPDMPKNCSAQFWLGQLPDGRWARRAILKRCSDNSDTHMTVGALDDNGVLLASRAGGLRTGLQMAAKFFEKNKGAVKALEAFHEKLGAGEGSPANTEAAAETPPAAVEAGPRMYDFAFLEIPVARIQVNPKNHRKHFDPVALRELADSIQQEGLHQPIGVRQLLPGEAPEGEFLLAGAQAPEYELIYGERRWRALQMAGFTLSFAKVYRGLKREQTHAIGLIENLQREGINAMEEAGGYAELMAAEGLTQEQCAARVGKERSTVANVLRLLNLPAPVRELVGENKLTKAHGIALARFVPAEKDRDAVPKWEMIVTAMAEAAAENRTPAGAMEKGIPSLYGLAQAGLIVRIGAWGAEKVTDKLKKHPAYFAVGDGEWVCFDPPHWEAEVAKREEAREKREAAAEATRKEELEKLAKRGRKQVKLEDLDRDAYRKLDDETTAGLNDLVPEDRRIVARESGRNVTVITDVELADRLKSAMQREIKKDRKAKVADLEAKVLKKITGLRKLSGREWGWLVYCLADADGRRVHLHLKEDAAKAADVSLPAEALSLNGEPPEYDRNEMSWEAAMQLRADRRLDALSRVSAVDLVRVLMAERLPVALSEIVEGGPASTGARFVRWWLESDSLWLLEESDEGRVELVERVKAAPWYARALAGESAGEGGDE